MTEMYKEIRKRERSGQSLIEVMMAITMLTVGFLGIATLLSRSLALNRVTANDVTATYLASEGIEIAKNLIDHDVYSSGDGQWGACFTGHGTTDFELDYATRDCSSLPAYDPSHYLLFNPATHLYGYPADMTGAPTIFTRDVKVVVNGPEIKVNSVVYWTGLDGAQGNINLEDHFWNWY